VGMQPEKCLAMAQNATCWAQIEICTSVNFPSYPAIEQELEAWIKWRL
jgi:hypothetical protein